MTIQTVYIQYKQTPIAVHVKLDKYGQVHVESAEPVDQIPETEAVAFVVSPTPRG
jgi:hypothetical protein